MAKTTAVTDSQPLGWFVNFGGKIFGPYSFAQMSEFVHEERVRGTSVIKCGQTGQWMQAAVEPQVGGLFNNDAAASPPPPKPLAKSKDSGLSNVIVVGHFRTRSVDTFERALGQFGEVLALTPNSWILRTNLAVSVLRNDLVKFLGASDRLFIVDGKRGKVSWSNFGPSEEARLRSFVAAARDDER